jgi:hydroxymethylpyrimidine/phosphomethylpyrimidine kinase
MGKSIKIGRDRWARRSVNRGRSHPTLPLVLTIGGSDSGSGAGIQSDTRTIQALGGYTLTVVTAITAQNTRGVQRWSPVAPALLRAQLDSVLGDFKIAAIKTGLIPGATAVRAISSALSNLRRIPLVVDPVIGSTSGTRFLPAAALKLLKRELLPRATLVTPNWPEATALTGRTIRTHRDAQIAALALVEECGCAVLLKGGHGPADADCRDCLVLPDGRMRWFSSPRVKTRNTHGTGCVLSATIATELAHGKSLEAAVQRARAFLLRSLRRLRDEDWGGAGPAFPG